MVMLLSSSSRYDLSSSEVDIRSSVAWCTRKKDQQVAIIVQDRMMKIEVSSSSWWLIAGVKIDTGHLLKLPL